MALKQISPENTSIGWIGTGVMGASMCRHMMDAGYQVTVYSRTASKAGPLIDAGAQWVNSPREVAQRSDVVFSIVGFPADVREVHLGDEGTLAGSSAGKIIVDMTTSEPALAEEMYAIGSERGIALVDAPVSGGDIGAQKGTLSIMIGGDSDVVAALQPLWETIGQTIVYQGNCGAGQHTKMVNQTLIATNMIGVCEALLYAYRAGLNLETVMQSVSSGAAGSWSLSNLGPRIIDNNFDPGFFVEHFIKDMGIAIGEANRMNLSLPGLALAHQLYIAVRAQGDGLLGTHALHKAIASLSGVAWTDREDG